MYGWECLFCRNYLFSHFLSTTNTTLFLALPVYSLIRSSGFSQAASSWTEHDWFLAKAGGSGNGICHYWNRPQQQSSLDNSIHLSRAVCFGLPKWLQRVIEIVGIWTDLFFSSSPKIKLTKTSLPHVTAFLDFIQNWYVRLYTGRDSVIPFIPQCLCGCHQQGLL